MKTTINPYKAMRLLDVGQSIALEVIDQKHAQVIAARVVED